MAIKQQPETLTVRDYASPFDDFLVMDGNEDIKNHIEAGRLPEDFYFRMNAVGYSQPDWRDETRSLPYQILDDCRKNATDPNEMRPDTRRLIFGDPPAMVIDWHQSANRQVYPLFETMHYRLGNVASAIKRRRAARGETIPDLTDQPLYSWEREQAEHARCFALARPIWRLIVRQYHPEWIEDPKPYYMPTFTFTEALYAGERTMARRIIGATVISDTIMYATYQEAVSIGIKGIAEHGIDSLRELLADEHPELYDLAR